jgi:uncharacterized glyoxalase superfamily protein PhnB
MSKEKATIIPTMKYQNAQSAIEWLCSAFGFEKHLIVQGENDNIAHAQLTLGNAMIMLGSVSNDEYGKLIQTPKKLNGLNTQAPYIIVENIDEHYKKAVQEGAEIVIEIKDEDYGGRGYTCRDKEGHIWNFGSYDPWNE